MVRFGEPAETPTLLTSWPFLSKLWALQQLWSQESWGGGGSVQQGKTSNPSIGSLAPAPPPPPPTPASGSWKTGQREQDHMRATYLHPPFNSGDCSVWWFQHCPEFQLAHPEVMREVLPTPLSQGMSSPGSGVPPSCVSVTLAEISGAGQAGWRVHHMETSGVSLRGRPSITHYLCTAPLSEDGKVTLASLTAGPWDSCVAS